MKALMTSSGPLGPFANVERLGDRWHCDGTDYPDAVIGAAEVVDADGVIFPAPPEPPPPVPEVVSPFQAKVALAEAGMFDAIEAMMANPATDIVDRLAWREATEFRRASPTVIRMGTALGMSSDQLDELFRYAATVVA